MVTREQQRMSAAWERLTGYLGSEPDAWSHQPEAAQYLAALRRTPVRIHSCGLGQALAALNAREQEPGRQAYRDLSAGVSTLMGTTGDLLGQLRQGDLALLMRATEETMGLVGWMSRYLLGAGVPTGDSDEASNEASGDESVNQS